jgi:hypothetical protein
VAIWGNKERPFLIVSGVVAIWGIINFCVASKGLISPVLYYPK